MESERLKAGQKQNISPHELRGIRKYLEFDCDTAVLISCIFTMEDEASVSMGGSGSDSQNG